MNAVPGLRFPVRDRPARVSAANRPARIAAG